MNILIIGLHYHDYTQAIAQELVELGHSVSVHDLQPRDFLMKSLRIVAPRIWQRRLDSHHRSILKAEQGKAFDLVLFIQAHQIKDEILSLFKATFPEARFALFNWDSVANHDYLDKVQFFDTVQTFDPVDAEKYGFLYLPLFAMRDFQGAADRVENPRSVYFVGNIVNPRRYRVLNAFRSYCRSHEIEARLFMAATPLTSFWMRRDGLKPKGLAKGSISKVEFREMLETSAAVFDFANHDQSGYTMRIFENLCARKKIITNNRRIVHEEFYSDDRIFLIDEGNFSGVERFLDAPLQNPDKSFPEYHIQAFVKHLASGTGHSIPHAKSDR